MINMMIRNLTKRKVQVQKKNKTMVIMLLPRGLKMPTKTVRMLVGKQKWSMLIMKMKIKIKACKNKILMKSVLLMAAQPATTEWLRATCKLPNLVSSPRGIRKKRLWIC